MVKMADLRAKPSESDCGGHVPTHAMCSNKPTAAIAWTLPASPPHPPSLPFGWCLSLRKPGHLAMMLMEPWKNYKEALALASSTVETKKMKYICPFPPASCFPLVKFMVDLVGMLLWLSVQCPTAQEEEQCLGLGRAQRVQSEGAGYRPGVHAEVEGEESVLVWEAWERVEVTQGPRTDEVV